MSTAGKANTDCCFVKTSLLFLLCPVELPIYGSGRFSMAKNAKRLQLEQRPSVNFFQDKAHKRMP